MSEFTDKQDALDAIKCKECNGGGEEHLHGGGQRDEDSRPCKDCNGSGIAIDPFEEFKEKHKDAIDELVNVCDFSDACYDKGTLECFIEHTFNAGRESK